MTQAEKITTMKDDGWSVGKLLGYHEEDADAITRFGFPGGHRTRGVGLNCLLVRVEVGSDADSTHKYTRARSVACHVQSAELTEFFRKTEASKLQFYL